MQVSKKDTKRTVELIESWIKAGCTQKEIQGLIQDHNLDIEFQLIGQTDSKEEAEKMKQEQVDQLKREGKKVITAEDIGHIED